VIGMFVRAVGVGGKAFSLLASLGPTGAHGSGATRTQVQSVTTCVGCRETTRPDTGD
jgi:hypothetical protein